MQKTIALLLFLFVISGGIFSGCKSDDVKVEEAENSGEVEVAAEVVSEDKTEIKAASKNEVSVQKKVASDEPVVTTKYIDGSYTQTGGYQSPAGPETVTVTVTLRDDVVTGLTVTPNAVNENSVKFQGQFVAGINTLVVGKKIDEIGGFTQVNGSSLTPQGFSAALDIVKTGAVNKN